MSIVTPEDYTGPREFVHLHNHTVFSAQDGVATPEQYAARCVEFGHPAMSATEHGHMASVPDMYLAFRQHKIKYIAGCFKPDQPIITYSGVKNIEDICYGDRALSSENHFRDIKNVQIRQFNGEMIRIKSWGVEDQVSTPDHPFLIREVTRNEIKKGVWHENIDVRFEKAQNIFREKYHRTYSSKRSEDRSNKRRYRFYLCVPRIQPEASLTDVILADYAFADDYSTKVTNGIIESVTYTRNGYRSTFDVGLPYRIKLDSEFLWIAGLWLAEGSADQSLEFSLGGDEYHFYERISDYFAEFGITTSYRFRNGDGESRKRDALDVTVYSSYFARLFNSLFGGGFDNKSIPIHWITRSSREQAKCLLDGLFDGDAKIGPKQSYLKLCNRNLVWQARMLMTKLEVPQYSAITEIPNNNSDNVGYTLRRRESGHFYYDYDDKYIYLPVYAIEKELYSGSVYNIEVDRDNSYHTGVAVHNCEIYFNDFEPYRRQLASRGIKYRSKEWKEENPLLYSRIARNRHLTLLAKNETGFHNLIKLTTQAYESGLFGMGTNQYNRIWFDKLCEFKEGIIVLSGCLNGPVCHELRLRELSDKEGNITYERKFKEAVKDAIDWIKKFKAAFGEDYYIELQMPGIPGDDLVFKNLISIADKFGLKIVLANDCHYLKREDFMFQKIMMAASQGVTVDSPDLFHVNSDEQFMKSRADLWARFKNNSYSDGIDDAKFEEMCDNTLSISDKCEQLKIDATPKIPEIGDADNELRKLVARRLKDSGLINNKRRFLIDGREVTYLEQAKIELDRFIDKGFASYFLITKDLIGFGKERGWPFSPRGSAGGSLVCFLLGIHVLDPMLWGLSFDRFLSPSRGGYMLNVKMNPEMELV